MRKLIIKVACLFFLLAGIQNSLIAQDTTAVSSPRPKKELSTNREVYPNPIGKGMMVPSGWGAPGLLPLYSWGVPFPRHTAPNQTWLLPLVSVLEIHTRMLV